MFTTIASLCMAIVTPSSRPALPPPYLDRGYRGIWYMNQPQNDPYKYKYSGGFATYPQQHIPLAVHAPKVNKTFFVYGGRAADANRIVNCISFFDHATGTVPRPLVLLERPTNDTHFNPTLSIDSAGYIYVFCNSHGAGSRSYIFRSDRPHSIDSFTVIRNDNFSYSQPWRVEGQGLLWLHTRYQKNQRRLCFSSSADGLSWSEPTLLVHIEEGDYQISWARGRRVATAFDHHPAKVGLNARTNLYYLQTDDLGKTWTTAAGAAVHTPITRSDNPALIHDYQKEGLLVYLKDLTFDLKGNPVILYLTAKSFRSGPQGGDRVWHTARWTGEQWTIRPAVASDHNYDHGSLYIESNGSGQEQWRLVAPTDPGPQPHATGGAIVIWTSDDQGRTWNRQRTIGAFNSRNQTYVRRPFDAHAGFYAFWADGDALNASASDLYFADKAGRAFRLPRTMREPARPRPVGDEDG